MAFWGQVLQCVTRCCSVLQGVAGCVAVSCNVCCSMLQYCGCATRNMAFWGQALKCVAVCCRVCCSELPDVLQHIAVLCLRVTNYCFLGAVCCSMLQYCSCERRSRTLWLFEGRCCSVLQYVAVCCSVLQCVVVCVMQFVVV